MRATSMANFLLIGRAMKTAIASVLLLGACAADEPRLEASASDPLPADLAEGDRIFRDDIAVNVPARGQSVTIIVDRENGEWSTLSVSNSLDGIVSLVDAPGESGPEPLVIASASTRPCDDDAYALTGHKWATEYQWRFQASTTPTRNNKDLVEQGLRNSVEAIETSHNDCGLADRVSATARYLGRTSLAPNIPGTSTTIDCGTGDNTNVVGFGVIPVGILGVTCYWTDANHIDLESDVMLSTSYSWFPLDVPPGCSGRYGVEAVATHEFGHAFGLAHVTKPEHPNLTMSAGVSSCTNAPYTLGLGDVLALRKLY